MGLDIAFDRKAAIDAGIALRKDTRTDPIEWADAIDKDHLRWMQEEIECIRVPGMGHWAENAGADTEIIVRANKWGNTYAPLTDWLSKHQITWSEF